MKSTLVIELKKVKIVPKKTVVRFTYRKFVKQSLHNRKKLKSLDKSTLGLTNAFINENLNPVNNRIAYNCRKLKGRNSISKTYTVNCMVHLNKQQY